MEPDPARPAGAGPGGFGSRIDGLVELIGECTSWLTLVIVVLMAVNVIMRYLFSVGSVWSQELEWHLLVPLILFGMSYALRHGEHVRVDIFYGRYSDRKKALVDLFSAFLGVAISAIIIWLSINYVQQSFVIDESSADPGGLPHRYIIKALIPVGFALLLLQSIAAGLKALDKLRSTR